MCYFQFSLARSDTGYVFDKFVKDGPFNSLLRDQPELVRDIILAAPHFQFSLARSAL
jgi:hypothetical protein